MVRSKDSGSQLSKNIPKMYAFHFLRGMSFIGGVLVPFFTVWGKISFTQIMILQSWFIFWVAVLNVPGGSLADLWGRKKTLVAGSALNALGAWVYVTTPDFRVFLIGEFLLAFGNALIRGSDEALIYGSLQGDGWVGDGLRETASRVFRRLRSFALMATLISSPIGGTLAVRLGLQFPLIFMGLFSLVATLVGLCLTEPMRSGGEKRAYLEILKGGFFELARDRKLQKLSLDLAVVASLSKMMLWLYQPLLLANGFPMASLGVIHAVAVGLEVMVILGLGVIERVLGSRSRVFLATSLLSGLAFLLTGISNLVLFQPLLGSLFGALIVIGFGLSREPLFSVEFNERISSESRRATILAAVGVLPNVLTALLNPLVGRMGDWSLSWTTVILGLLLTGYVVVSRVVVKVAVG